MPDIKFYMDQEHWDKYRQIEKETKTKIMAKARKLIYQELDKLSPKK